MAADPFLWIAPIIAACFSKGRWWLVPLAAVVWGALLEFTLRPALPDYRGDEIGLHLAAALLNGFVVLGIATVIRKLFKPAPPAATTPNDPPETPTNPAR